MKIQSYKRWIHVYCAWKFVCKKICAIRLSPATDFCAAFTSRRLSTTVVLNESNFAVSSNRSVWFQLYNSNLKIPFCYLWFDWNFTHLLIVSFLKNLSKICFLYDEKQIIAKVIPFKSLRVFMSLYWIVTLNYFIKFISIFGWD